MALTLPPLSILYRGPLSSCNYDCHYCPFAKRQESASELRADRAALERFIAWASAVEDFELSFLFTPWGEALPHSWYQQALIALSRLPHVRRAAIQTNLTCRLEWLDRADVAKLALWCTYHPSQIARADFVARCRELDARGVPYTVGVVGLRESLDEIDSLRDELAPEVYLWINAYKEVPDYYREDDVRRLERIDPAFRYNLQRHASFGLPCDAGERAISVDGAGNIRRCHFVGEILGNLYAPHWRQSLQPRCCPNATCGCYIGYVNLPHLDHDRLFGPGKLERLPERPFHREPLTRELVLQLAAR
jgi:MoaA/NifB/PqqE/SkfB family radical SAM enzyme